MKLGGHQRAGVEMTQLHTAHQGVFGFERLTMQSIKVAARMPINVQTRVIRTPRNSMMTLKNSSLRLSGFPAAFRYQNGRMLNSARRANHWGRPMWIGSGGTPLRTNSLSHLHGRRTSKIPLDQETRPTCLHQGQTDWGSQDTSIWDLP